MINETNDEEESDAIPWAKITPINKEAAQDLEIKLRKQEAYGRCHLGHKKVMIDEKGRTVTCRDCGYVIDAFDYMLQWAKDGDHRNQGLKNIEIQRKICAAEVADLDRQIRNMRSVLKRAGMPQTPQERGKFDRLRCNPHLVEKEGL